MSRRDAISVRMALTILKLVQITAILEDVAEVSPEDVTESSVLMDDLDLSSMAVSYTHL